MPPTRSCHWTLVLPARSLTRLWHIVDVCTDQCCPPPPLGRSQVLRVGSAQQLEPAGGELSHWYMHCTRVVSNNSRDTEIKMYISYIIPETIYTYIGLPSTIATELKY